MGLQMILKVEYTLHYITDSSTPFYLFIVRGVVVRILLREQFSLRGNQICILFISSKWHGIFQDFKTLVKVSIK